MSKESPEAINDIFKLAISCHTGKEKDKNKAIARIKEIHGTNIGSCDMYIGIISCMLKGVVYKRAMSAGSTENVLKNIYLFNNSYYLGNALLSLESHIKYYENKYRTNAYKLRSVLDKWLSLGNDSSNNNKSTNDSSANQGFSSDDLYSDISEINTSQDLTDTEKDALVKARIGQGEFRKNVIQTWGLGESCPVTKVSTREILIASHIKPWRNCTTKEERLDGSNGILICSHLDKLFDSHLVSFKKVNDSYDICFNNKLDVQELEKIGITKKLQLNTEMISAENKVRLQEFLAGHLSIFNEKQINANG